MADESVRDLPEKLRVTATLLGCASQKDLCAAFHRVNPNSDLERSYKWMQGRALPRSARVYEDWAAPVGAEGRPPSWLASCPLREFVDALCMRHGLERDAPLRRAALDAAFPTGAAGAHSAAKTAAAAGPEGCLCGAYACYSHARSALPRPGHPRRAGGRAGIEAPGRADRNLLAGASVWSRGSEDPVGFYGLTLCLELRVPSPGIAPLFCSLFRPSPPASVLAGVMCGVAAVHPGGQPPYATRIAMVRVPPATTVDRLHASNRCFGPAEWPPSGDLAALGLPVPDPVGLDAQIDRFLNPGGGSPGCDRASINDYAALAMACDRMGLDGAAHADDRAPFPCRDEAEAPLGATVAGRTERAGPSAGLHRR
jgi:hypothetical protein